MIIVNHNFIFKNKITEDVYHFDILARKDNDFYPQLAGFVVVNLKTGAASLSFDVGTNVLNKEKLCKEALEFAKNIKNVIEG